MDPQNLGGRGSVAPAFFENGSEDGGLGELQELFVKGRVGGIGLVAEGALGPGGEQALDFECHETVSAGRVSRRRREVLRPDRLAAGDDGRMLDRVAQLADVAGPGLGCGARRGRRRRAWSSATSARRACLKKCSARAGMSSRRSRKRGKVDLEDAEAEEQVFAEFTGRHQLAQRAVGRRDDPDVGEPRPRVADRRDFAVLDGPQQLDLEARGDVADLVQQHGPAAGELEQPLSILDRPGERPLDVPEELALDQARD